MGSRTGLALLVILLLAGVQGIGSAQAQLATSYDGHWWLSASEHERFGFLNGYLDCYCYEYRGTAKFERFSFETYGQMITKFYRETTDAQKREAIPRVLDRFRDPAGWTAPDQSIEEAPGPHGGYDGLFWRQMFSASGRAEQTAFVAGYIWCHSALNLSRGGAFSKTAAEYVPLITQWYRFDEGNGDVDAEREGSAIAEVLMRFRDIDSPQAPK